MTVQYLKRATPPVQAIDTATAETCAPPARRHRSGRRRGGAPLRARRFGADEPAGFTSVWTHWRYFSEPQSLPNAERVLGGLCDMRLPLTLSRLDCAAIASVMRAALVSLEP